MNWFTGTVLYILTWVLTLFVVLPIGTKSQAEPDAATGWRGAPTQARMWRKALITTIATTILFTVMFVVIEEDWLSFRHGILAGS